MTFNDKIDLFMEENKYDDLKRLATDSDIPYTTLRDFYIKKSADNSRLSTIRKLATFMNCTMDYLTYDDLTNPTQIKIDNSETNLSNEMPVNSYFDELEILFSKNKDLLTDEDKEYIRFIIEKRKREIDKELGENDK